MGCKLWLAIFALALSIALQGCFAGGQKRLADAAQSRRVQLEAVDPIFSKTELRLESTGSGTFRCSLVNRGKETLEVLPPIRHYSLRVLFFDGRGEGVSPSTLRAVTLPGGPKSMRVLMPPGNSESEAFSRADLSEEYGGLERCRFIALEYMPSEFALEPFEQGSLDVPKLPLLSNPLPW